MKHRWGAGALCCALAVIGCAPAPPSMLAAGDRARRAGNHGQAYWDYRAALYYQLPQDVDEHQVARRRMIEAFHAWVQSQVEDLRAQAAADPAAAFNGLLQLRDGPVGVVEWEAAEIKTGPRLRPELTEDERAAIDATLREVAALLLPVARRSFTDAKPVLAAAQAHAIAPYAPDAKGLLSEIRVAFEAVTSALGLDSYLALGGFHGAIADWIGGDAGGWTYLDFRFAFEGAPACDAFHQRLEASGGKMPARVRIDDEVCELEESVRTGSETVVVGYDTVEGPQERHCLRPSAIGEENRGCYTTRGTERVPITEQRDYQYLDWSVRWSGRAIIEVPPFEVSRTLRLADAGTEKASIGSAIDLPVSRFLDALDPKGIRTELAAQAIAASERARDAGDAVRVADYLVEAAMWEPTHAAAIDGIAAEYHVPASVISDILEGRIARTWPGAPAARAADTWTTPATAMKGCSRCVANGVWNPKTAGKTQAPGAMNMGVRASRMGESTTVTDFENAVAFQFSLVQEPKQAAGVTVISNAEVGFGTGGGFLYDLDVVVGPGLRAGPLSASIGGGFGLGGVTGGRLGFGWQVPIEARLALRVGPAALEWTGTAQFVLKEDPRQDGSAHAPFGDELRTSLGLHLIRPNYQGSRHGKSLYVGADYREARDTEWLGVVVRGAMMF